MIEVGSEGLGHGRKPRVEVVAGDVRRGGGGEGPALEDVDGPHLKRIVPATPNHNPNNNKLLACMYYYSYV